MIVYRLAFVDKSRFIPCPKAHLDKQPKTRGEVLLLF